MEIWDAHYRDEYHDLDCEILNYGSGESDPFRLCIDGVTFKGCDLDDWEIDAKTYEADRENIDRRFSIFRFGSREKGYHYMLQGYSLSLWIPVVMFSTERQRREQGELEIVYSSFSSGAEDMLPVGSCYVLDDEKVYPDHTVCENFTLHISGECFQAEVADLFFDTSLEVICHQIKERYYMCNCYGCLYSDYSPYGCSNIGMMACFAENAEKYLRVNGKYSQHLKEGECTIWDVFAEGYEQRQETELCERFKPRADGLGGYRGLIYK